MTKAGSIATVRAMSRWPNASARRAQRGAVLVVGLVMLTVMTLLVVSMIRTSVVELKIGGASQIAQQNLTNAELMINSFLNANNSRFAAHYLALPGATGGPAATASGSPAAAAASTAASPATSSAGRSCCRTACRAPATRSSSRRERRRLAGVRQSRVAERPPGFFCLPGKRRKQHAAEGTLGRSRTSNHMISCN